MDIAVLETERLISVHQGRPPMLDQAQMATIGTPEDEQPLIIVGPDAYSALDAHAQSDLSREVGGFMIGRPYKWQGQTYVEIVDALPGQSTHSGAGHLTITHDTWAQARALVRERASDLHIVGWYHTHPRMYVFMSSQDIAIHEGFFPEPWHVSLVLEPHRREAGFFCWDQGRVRAAGGYRIVYPEGTPAEVRWIPPAPLQESISAASYTVDDFYQAGTWRTRWQETDELAVRVRYEVIEAIQREATSGPALIYGLCLGQYYLGPEGKNPHYFVDVTDVRTVVCHRSLKQLDLRVVVDAVARLKETVRKETRQRVVGDYWLASGSHPLLDKAFTHMQRIILAAPYRILLIGHPVHGIETCRWRQTNDELVTHPLIEMIALPRPISGRKASIPFTVRPVNT